MKKKIVTLICALLIIISGGMLLFKAATLNFVVDGTSMNPLLYEGEIGYANTWINKAKLKRFDVVIFEREGSLKVKRVIGLPGERVKYQDNHLYVNDELVEETFLSESAMACTCSTNYTLNYNICLEEVSVGDDEYFVMGDNRGESYDSRGYGAIKIEQVVGVPFYVYNKQTKERRFI